MYIASAKFEEHCLNISRVILDWMLCCLSGITYDVITFLICIIQKREYLQNEKRHAKKENAILLYSAKPFKQAAIIFYVIDTLNKPPEPFLLSHVCFVWVQSGWPAWLKCSDTGVVVLSCWWFRIERRCSPKAFPELTLRLSDVLQVAGFTFYQVYEVFWVARYGVRDFSSFVSCKKSIACLTLSQKITSEAGLWLEEYSCDSVEWTSRSRRLTLRL